MKGTSKALTVAGEALSLTLCLPSVVAAQGAPVAPAARPAFQPLRFEEDWSRVDRRAHWDDAIKAVPLGAGASLTVGGQVRWRDEFARDFGLTALGDRYGQSRVLLHADVQAGSADGLRARTYVEFRDAQSYGRSLPGGTRAVDADRSDVQNLFGDIAYGRSFVRVGRQEIELGRGRLVGVPDWANTRQSMQGGRARLSLGAVALDAFAVRPVVVRLDARNVSDTTTRFRGVSLSGPPRALSPARHGAAAWQLYWLDQSITLPTTTRRLTTGARATATFAHPRDAARSYGLDVEGAVQRGSSGAQSVRAWFWTTEAQTRWLHVRGTPTLAVGLDAASGDRDAADKRLEAFNTLYASSHAFGGDADVFGRANARDTHAAATWEPLARLSLRAAWHRVDRVRLTDGVYTKQNGLLRAASGSRERHAGDELDVGGGVTVTRHLKATAGAAYVLPGAFMRSTPGSARPERWGYAGTTYTF